MQSVGSILFLQVFTNSGGGLFHVSVVALSPEFATVMIVEFGFMGKRCICRSHLISFISGMYYHLTKLGGSYFKVTFLIQGTRKIS